MNIILVTIAVIAIIMAIAFYLKKVTKESIEKAERESEILRDFSLSAVKPSASPEVMQATARRGSPEPSRTVTQQTTSQTTSPIYASEVLDYGVTAMVVNEMLDDSHEDHRHEDTDTSSTDFSSFDDSSNFDSSTDSSSYDTSSDY